MHVSITTAEFNDGRMWLQLSDGRTLGIPLVYFPVLANADVEQLAKFELSPHGIHWEDLNEDLAIKGLLTIQPLQKLLPRIHEGR